MIPMTIRNGLPVSRLLARWKRRDDGFHVDVVQLGNVIGCIVPVQAGVTAAYSVAFTKNPEAAAAQWARKTVQAGLARFNMEFHHVRVPG